MIPDDPALVKQCFALPGQWTPGCIDFPPERSSAQVGERGETKVVEDLGLIIQVVTREAQVFGLTQHTSGEGFFSGIVQLGQIAIDRGDKRTPCLSTGSRK